VVDEEDGAALAPPGKRPTLHGGPRLGLILAAGTAKRGEIVYYDELGLAQRRVIMRLRLWI